MRISEFTESQWMYHGTTRDFDKLRANRDEYMMDRALGSHFASDVRMADKFAQGLYTSDKAVGTVLKTRTPPRSQLLKVPQKKYPHGARRSDQAAIGAYVSATVFQQPENRNMFIDWVTNARRIDSDTAQEIYDLLLAGKAPADAQRFDVAASRGSNSFRSYMANFDPNLTLQPYPDFKKQVIAKFIDIMKSRGVSGLVYKNTSPREIQDIRSDKSYVIFEPEKLELTKSVSEGSTIVDDSASEAEQIAAVSAHGWKIASIANPSEAVQMAAVKRYGRAIEHIANPTEAVQIAAAQNYYDTIASLVHNGIRPSTGVQLAALGRSGLAIEDIEAINPDIWKHPQARRLLLQALIKYINKKEFPFALRLLRIIRDRQVVWPELETIERTIKNRANLRESEADDEPMSRRPTGLDSAAPDVQLKVVSNYPVEIRKIKNPSEEVQMAAVTVNGDALQYIKNPSPAVQLAAVKEYAPAIQYIENPSEELQMVAVKSSPGTLRNIKNPSRKVQLFLVQYDGNLLRLIENPSEEVQMAAIKSDPWQIANVSDPSEEMQLLAVGKVGHTIKYIRNPSEKVQLAAINEHPHSIVNIRNPSERVQIQAILENPSTFEDIQNFSPALWNMLDVKKRMLGSIMEKIKNNRTLAANRLINSMLDNKCPWTELTILKKRLENQSVKN